MSNDRVVLQLETPARPSGYASHLDLDHHRESITKLYWDENHDLPEVINIIEQRYSFKATLVY